MLSDVRQTKRGCCTKHRVGESSESGLSDVIQCANESLTASSAQKSLPPFIIVLRCVNIQNCSVMQTTVLRYAPVTIITTQVTLVTKRTHRP
jgi:hypothetical protein